MSRAAGWWGRGRAERRVERRAEQHAAAAARAALPSAAARPLERHGGTGHVCLGPDPACSGPAQRRAAAREAVADMPGRRLDVSESSFFSSDIGVE